MFFSKEFQSSQKWYYGWRNVERFNCVKKTPFNKLEVFASRKRSGIVWNRKSTSEFRSTDRFFSGLFSKWIIQPKGSDARKEMDILHENHWLC